MPKDTKISSTVETIFNHQQSIFNDLFGKFSGTSGVASITVSESDLKSYRSRSDDVGMILEIDLPGVAMKNVKLWTVGRQVVVQGTKGDREFTNRYSISEEFDLNVISATMSHGQLVVTIQRVATKPAKRITIKEG